MKKRALSYYFKGVKVTDDSSTANREIKAYFEKNGFGISSQESFYIRTSGYPIKGRIQIAIQLSTKKRIAFCIDNLSPRANSISKLENVVADRKVIFLRNPNISQVTGERYKYNDEIEIIHMPLKTEHEIIAFKKEEMEKIKSRKLSSLTKLKGDNEKVMYDFAMEYMVNMLEQYNQLPKFNGLQKKMEEMHPVLYYALIEQKKCYTVLKKAHKEMCAIRYKKSI